MKGQWLVKICTPAAYVTSVLPDNFVWLELKLLLPFLLHL